MIKNCLLCNAQFRTYPSKIKMNRGKYCSKKCSDKITLIKRGVRVSILTEIKKGQKLALGIKRKTAWNKGIKGVCKPNATSFKRGYHYSPETEFKKGIPVFLHPRWQGGKSFEPYPLGWNKTFKEQIRYRDGYKCQLCATPEIELKRKLSIHHIDYNKANITEKNLISLCLSCHMKTNVKRSYWEGVVFNAHREMLAA